MRYLIILLLWPAIIPAQSVEVGTHLSFYRTEKFPPGKQVGFMLGAGWRLKGLNLKVGCLEVAGQPSFYGGFQGAFPGADWLSGGMELLIFNSGTELNGLPKDFGGQVTLQWKYIRIFSGFSTKTVWVGIGVVYEARFRPAASKEIPARPRRIVSP